MVTQLNWYFPRSMGGLGMKLPDGVRFVNQNEYRKLMKIPDNPEVVRVVLVTNKQLRLACRLKEAWTTPYEKVPMEPIGMQKDLDADDRAFADLKKHHWMISIPVGCPRPRTYVDLPTDSHPPNWDFSAMDSREKERLVYTFKGLKNLWFRGTTLRIDLNDEFLHSELVSLKIQ
jgi:hypothetical protein